MASLLRLRRLTRKLIRWGYLVWVAILLAAFGVAETIIGFVYRAFPFPGALDYAFENSAQLRRWFSYQLRGGDKPAECIMTTPELIRHAGYGCEEHSATTADGFVLVLQRIVPPGAERLGVPSRYVPYAAQQRAERQSALPDEMDPFVDASAFPCEGSDESGPLTPSGLPSLIRRSSSRSSNRARSHPSENELLENGPQHLSEEDDGAASSSWNPEGWKAWKAMHPANQRPPILLMHGLMQSSECYVCNGRKSLAFMLVDAGYDVWLGNNRGNQYSSKHIQLRPDDEAFWDYSIDELARYDLPAMIKYILVHSGHARLSYVGFSQGTAQAFAALSSHPDLARRVVSFVALSPAVAIHGLQQSPLTSLVQADLGFINLLFGDKRILPSTVTWQRILHLDRWVWLIDRSLKFLFSWSTENLDPGDKPVLYSHLYSFSSVKTVVHWFQMMRAGRFQMYDDTGLSGDHPPPPRYDVGVIRCPIAAFVGGADTVIDSRRLLRELPRSTFLFWEPTYEHLDFLWGKQTTTRAFPAVLHFLDYHHGRRSTAPVSHPNPHVDDPQEPRELRSGSDEGPVMVPLSAIDTPASTERPGRRHPTVSPDDSDLDEPDAEPQAHVATFVPARVPSYSSDMGRSSTPSSSQPRPHDPSEEADAAEAAGTLRTVGPGLTEHGGNVAWRTPQKPREFQPPEGTTPDVLAALGMDATPEDRRRRSFNRQPSRQAPSQS